MRLFGLEISRSKAAVGATDVSPLLGSSTAGGWFNIIREGFSGAWQRNIVLDNTETILAFSAVYACVGLIADDIAKLRIKLVQQTGAIWQEVTAASPFQPVLRKPNRYQTRIQFLSYWITSKLIWGNTYVLKERDGRGIVTALYVLDPRMVTPLVTADGGVYYRLSKDLLSQVGDQIVVPASEIIHDRALCLFHPLVGVGPIFAAGYSATQGNRIQNYSGKFFENMSRPSGMLTAPGTIEDVTAARLKADFETNFSGKNLGRLLVAGDDLKYEPFTMPANQSQLIEQLKWTGEDVARVFHVPAYKLGLGAPPTLNNIGALDQDYYKQTLQKLIEDIELLLDEGLELGNVKDKTLGTELDIEGLQRMDPLSAADVVEKLTKVGVLAPNEGRAKFNLSPTDGGETPYLQQQNFPLAVLAKQPPPNSTPPAAKPAIAPPADPAVDPATPPAKAAEEVHAIVDAVVRELKQDEEETVKELAEALIARFTLAASEA